MLLFVNSQHHAVIPDNKDSFPVESPTASGKVSAENFSGTPEMFS